jgi:hypothetical protein
MRIMHIPGENEARSCVKERGWESCRGQIPPTCSKVTFPLHIGTYKGQGASRTVVPSRAFAWCSFAPLGDSSVATSGPGHVC